jgi:hypothetical protein
MCAPFITCFKEVLDGKINKKYKCILELNLTTADSTAREIFTYILDSFCEDVDSI